jgi:hypothetical protein
MFPIPKLSLLLTKQNSQQNRKSQQEYIPDTTEVEVDRIHHLPVPELEMNK